MEKEPIRSERRDTKLMRIKNIHVNLLKEVGEGDQQKGLEKIIHIYKTIKRNPEKICMSHISDFMDDVEKFYGENHIGHMKNLPTALLRGLRHGGNCDFSIVKRPDETIDKFMKNKEKKNGEKK